MKKVFSVISIVAICAALGYFIGAATAPQQRVPPDAPYADSMTVEQKTDAIEAGRQQLKMMVQNKAAHQKREKQGC